MDFNQFKWNDLDSNFVLLVMMEYNLTKLL